VIHRTLNAVRQNLVAWLALFVALSGTSLATSHYVATAAKHGKPRAHNQLKGKTGPRGSTGATGPAGAPGIPGTAGTAGTAGPAGPVKLAYVESLPCTAPNGLTAHCVANCPPATPNVTGGGVLAPLGLRTSSSYPSRDVNGNEPADSAHPGISWAAFEDNSTGSESSFRVYAICTAPTSVG
jgi:hypothetical protein